MKFIKLGIISIIVFALLITMISFFFPSNIRISKAIDITSSRDSLLKKISDPVEWKKWYPGADTLQLFLVNGKAEGLEMNKQMGSLRVTGKTDSTITAETSGTGIREMKTGWNIIPSGTPNVHTVQWYMDIRLGWLPWHKFSGLLIEKRYGPSMEKGLDQLKTVLERSATTLDTIK